MKYPPKESKEYSIMKLEWNRILNSIAAVEKQIEDSEKYLEELKLQAKTIDTQIAEYAEKHIMPFQDPEEDN